MRQGTDGDQQTIEIERQFLVSSPDWDRGDAGSPIRQGYLARMAKGVVRVRTHGARAFLTVKSRVSGITRREFEYEIPPSHAEAMFALCDGAVIEKTRHRVPHAGHTWEVDVFAGANAGLVVAEIELRSEDEAFERPRWVGAEVSDDPRFKNSSLSLRPWDATWDVPDGLSDLRQPSEGRAR